jgi:hypothetical protein
MPKYLLKLRYYPGDLLEKIKKEDLKALERKYAAKIVYEKIENRKMKDGLLMEETLDKPIEDISQEVITVSSEREDDFTNCVRLLYKKYRSPRTAYSLLGSNDAGQKIAKRLIDLDSGW